ncbi:Coenzyme F420 hydrogenase/dehydrogenase, beta subunit C-terminal domain [Candidatus Bathycorpusculum sp.]|uniref:Coenzyme F420 hydrogenase/dehydrogenase, beta subunit C-terminal domain n=1 Tax=Candidatus Bathycorpusculum sp. TaxID=2994959 RepID=UPI002826DA44|nr:Coenzyme F420 hydrogenase/dehydrogenase, beta subunit C-terminal domain [Candidatus Termitimicrobium sp.]MCL2685151.1 Coenzyme F420 hydrogenase/dehydrogenase, beta subunit C-terminal domain [Candidatus Termitimicrobium sp.]
MSTKQTEKNPSNNIEDEMEARILEGAKDGALGVYCSLFSAKSQIEGQDGGVVTALLLKGLQKGLFDVAIVVHRKNGYNAEVTAAETTEEILTSKGSVYHRVNTTKKLLELVAQGKKRIAVVCTPCEGAIIRKLQQTQCKDVDLTIIGLFCFGAFNPQRLKEEIQTQLGVDLDRATKTQVKQGKFIVSVEGEEVSCRIEDLFKAFEGTCGSCGEFVSRLADISVGSAGSKNGYSTVIVRSEKGIKLVSELDVQIDTADKLEITKLAKLKKEQAENNNTKQRQNQ